MFIAVFHSWHVHSKGFEVIEIDTDDGEEANKIALVKQQEIERDFKSTAFELIRIKDGSIPIIPSTRWDKFICWIKYSHDMEYIGGGVDICMLCGIEKSDE